MNTPLFPTRLPAVIEKLKQHGHRITPQRVAILKAAIENPGHPTVEQVYETVRGEYPMTSLATVYKTLALMQDEHEAFELGFGGSARFDAAHPYPHPHLICTGCGRIVDLDPASLPAGPAAVATEHGFQLTPGRVDYYGLCPACQVLET